MIKCCKVRVILLAVGIHTPYSFHYSCLCISSHLALLPSLPLSLFLSLGWLSMSDDKLWPVWNLHLVLSLFNNGRCRNHSSLAAIVPLLALCDYSPSFSCIALSYSAGVYLSCLWSRSRAATVGVHQFDLLLQFNKRQSH